MSEGIQREAPSAGGGGRDASSGDLQDALLERIRAGEVRVGIIGLGYVGLPLARTFCDRGIAVLGFDVDPAKVERLGRGESYIKHIPAETIRAMRQGLFDATSDFRRLDEPDAILICVPTPLTDARDPDLTYVVSSARSIAERLRPGQLVVLESTTYPGTTREVVLPILAAGGLRPGSDFFLAFSPEREDPGNPQFSAPAIPKVADALNDRRKSIKGSKITLLRMAYKRDVDDPREGPGFELMELLLEKGAEVEYNDPHIPALPAMRRYPGLRMTSRELTEEYLASRDCVLIVTDHSAYDWDWIARHAPLIVDTRNATRGVANPRATIVRA
jgi:UDP-N-acetyl-D-mannosaminuronate dehydrogenase